MWSVHGDGKSVAPGAVVAPNERLSWPATSAIGIQHVIAMFGATFLVPLLTGFPVSTTLFFSGLGTLLFLLLTRNRLPSYLGSSFAFIAPIVAIGGTEGKPLTDPVHLAQAGLGVFIAGLMLAAVGLIVEKFGIGWIEKLMPPVVSGAIVALIGLNLAPVAWTNYQQAPITATITLASVIVFAVFFRGFLGRISIFLGVLLGYIFAVIRQEVDYSAIDKAAWVGLPEFHFAGFLDTNAWLVIPMFLPVVLVLIAENVGHVRGVATMVGDRKINDQTGRALFADGIATSLAGGFGGSGTTTYGENIGVMAATRIYSTAAYWVAGITAILLAFVPKFGAAIATIPWGVLGGATTALYGLIGVIGIKIWVDNQVDFSRPVNQYTVAVSFVMAIAGFTWSAGKISFGAIVLATAAALVIYHLGNAIARWRQTGADDGGPITAIGALGGEQQRG